MNQIEFRSDSSVELVDSMGSDYSVVRAARVSTGGDRLESTAGATEGLIRYLMKNRHGSPFESAVFQFRVECPIFVAREFMRHRIASFSEESARYKQLEAVFWVPAEGRPLVQEGKPGHYTLKSGEIWQYHLAKDDLTDTANYCYAKYEHMLEAGICREVARACLTVGIYTSFYVTMNARGLMNFLSLRIDDPESAYPSKPQYEIETAALQMQDIFAAKMPVTCDAFMAAGRVAP